MVNWTEILRANTERIVRAAEACGEMQPICVLFDIDQARARKESGGIMQLIADTTLKGAVPLVDPEKQRRFVCLAVSRDRLLAILDQYEEVEPLRKGVRGSGVTALWVVCCDGEERTCLSIHAATPDLN